MSKTTASRLRQFSLKSLNYLPAFGLLILNLLTLNLAYQVKEPCLKLPWANGMEYKTFCYNDLQPLYGARELDRKLIPYLEQKTFEYPPVVGFTMWVAAQFSSGHVQFFLAHLPVLILASLLTTWGLITAIGPSAKILWFVVSPPLIFYAYHNWDLLAIAPLGLAMGFRKKGWNVATGISLGVGAAAKLFPGFALAPLLVAAISVKKGPKGWKIVRELLLGAMLGWGVFNLPVLVGSLLKFHDLSGWTGMFQFHADRTPDFGSIWYWFPEMFVELRWIPLVVIFWGTVLTAQLFWNRRIEWKLSPWELVSVAGFGTFWFLWVGGVLSSDAVRRGSTSAEYKHLVDLVSFLTFLFLTLLFLGYGFVRKRSPWAMSGAITCLFLFVSKVHSPQYALWLLPFFVVLETPPVFIVLYFCCDALVYISGFSWLVKMGSNPSNGWLYPYVTGIYLRALLLLVLMVWYGWISGDRIESGPGRRFRFGLPYGRDSLS